MIEIRPGEPGFPDKFKMGLKDGDLDRDSEELPVHTFHFAKPFAIGRYEITFVDYGVYTLDKGLKQPENSG